MTADGSTIDVSQLMGFLEALDAQIEEVLQGSIEEAAAEMAKMMEAQDFRNLSHSTFVTQVRKNGIAVGPSRQGGRAHIVRFWEFGTVNNPAEGLMRRVADSAGGQVNKKMTRRLQDAIKISKGKKPSKWAY